MRYWVRIYRHGGDYSAMVPDLPGCVAAGDTVDEVVELITDAISLHLELMRQAGQTVLSPTRHVDLDVAELEEGEINTWVEIKTIRTQPRPKQRVGG